MPILGSAPGFGSAPAFRSPLNPGFGLEFPSFASGFEEMEITGTIHVATINGGALIYTPGQNVGDYLGGTVTVYDSAGKIATGYPGCSSGESISAELAADGVDWPDTNIDGLADGWNKFSSVATCIIVTGNGFSGNAQRAEYSIGTGIVGLVIYPLTSDKLYKYSFSYRSNKSLAIRLGTQGPDIPLNTGDAISTGFLFRTATGTGFYLRHPSNSSVSDYIEIDNVTVRQIISPSATEGCLVYSNIERTTQNFASVETGFNPNSIARIVFSPA
ncbi:MAG: hypothetical protein AB1847_18400 [bacterium]